ncbi:universal stress protein [Desulfobacula sp.]|uniref:universal stress protein n=1 Tax=Desulfobacula sp. TaxID=2593537 RepID=UPI002616E40D|nr:universal stress protein [Desulfobacula sp.]
MRIEPKKIMCAIDFSDFTNLILSYGKSLASEFDATLCLCHIVSGPLMVSSHMPPYLDYAGIESERIQNAQDKLERIAEKMDMQCEIRVSTGQPAEEIEQITRENNINMVIAATHGGSGIKRFLIGSVTNRLVKILSCPLLVLHAKEKHLDSPIEGSIKLNRILVGCDFSPDSQLAFDYALSLAQEFQTQLYLAHVMKPKSIPIPTADYVPGGDQVSWARAEYPGLSKKELSDNKKARDALLKSLEDKLTHMVPEDSRNWCTPITILLEGEPYKELITYAEKEKIDMIILGVHGYSLLEQFLVGSTTDRVISRAGCSVLAVRHIV